MTRVVLANMSWILWAIAMATITLTHRLSFWFPAEAFSLGLICVGFLWGVVMLVVLPKYGAGVKSTFLGIGLNGLILTIAIPNFFHGRHEALQMKAAMTAQAENVSGNASDAWKEYSLAGLQVDSPVALTKKEAQAQGASHPVELYTGQLLPSALSIALSRRELNTGEDCALQDVASVEADIFQQHFPQDFESSTSESKVEGIPARRLTIRFTTRGTPAQSTAMIFVKQPFIWEVKVVGPKNLPGLDADTERVFNSIKLIQTDGGLASRRD